MNSKRQFPIWHPFTQHAVMPEMTPIAQSEGAFLTSKDGRRIFDGISSWWVVTHGHCHPRIVDAISEQAGRLDQVIFAGHTHEPAEELAEKLLHVTPASLSHVFFSDSGSTSVEVALKMALGYWQNTGNADRTRIVVMENGYHGDTIGTMSVGERGVFNAAYEPLMFDVTSVPFPRPNDADATVAALELVCTRGDVAAFIVEPLVLGAGGMLMYPPEVLAQLKAVCEAHDVLFIADEVMTGWGRTGSMFACQKAGVEPDIACYSKGITGGSLPLAVTLCRSEIFDAHYSKDRSKTFFHSSSYTANPIACAAAVANLKIWLEEPVIERIADLADMQNRHIAQMMDDDRFDNVRQCGTIAAMDLKVRDDGYLSDVGPKLYAFFQERNLLLRPLGNTLYVMPPYCTTDDNLAEVYNAIAEAGRTFGS
ncbi:adenosylmethionine--8-amino-7-oxononanoate transaminase [Hoeflea prorocentri]|uniref:Adenosylmethionine-8-amino-7-oxononanoate aminotransferase n=1 Tax=Hoeflea prorocentri TaxID=1922333 RepID=A0A9X3UL78_9HYPH|nr:adenosylmethionine--8-amino-7-oxononanoate transaminase [Hoeflea prorocentri]MCY6382612.1 adenosylmethionine--8-amino-7-oxononanoate transaminase [Hoeflea prorocentri]MDA5400412.1 adenosylmethionine--8-amino-7-oxononanoate transaminase [Hoeflea prorocentri]